MIGQSNSTTGIKFALPVLSPGLTLNIIYRVPLDGQTDFRSSNTWGPRGMVQKSEKKSKEKERKMTGFHNILLFSIYFDLYTMYNTVELYWFI